MADAFRQPTCAAGHTHASSTACTSCSTDAVVLAGRSGGQCSQVRTRAQQGSASCSPNGSSREQACLACCATECRNGCSEVQGSSDHHHDGKSPSHWDGTPEKRKPLSRGSLAILSADGPQLTSLGRIRCRLVSVSVRGHGRSFDGLTAPCLRSKPSTFRRNQECRPILHQVATSLHHSTVFIGKAERING